jgi:uncharacterized protein
VLGRCWGGTTSGGLLAGYREKCPLTRWGRGAYAASRGARESFVYYSFDCDKAKTAVENAIRYSSEVASLDLTVDQSYRTRLGSLNNADCDILKREQKDRLRKRDLTCGNDTQLIYCLEQLYHARVFELEHFKQLHP